MVEPREVGAVGFHQAPAAAVAALGEHRYTGAAQRIHVAMDGPLGNFQALRQFTGGDPALDLQEQQNGEQAIGAHRAELIFPVSAIRYLFCEAVENWARTALREAV